MVDVEINVACSECGSTLVGKSASNAFDAWIIQVEPCERCLGAAREAGYDNGMCAGASND